MGQVRQGTLYRRTVRIQKPQPEPRISKRQRLEQRELRLPETRSPQPRPEQHILLRHRPQPLPPVRPGHQPQRHHPGLARPLRQPRRSRRHHTPGTHHVRRRAVHRRRLEQRGDLPPRHPLAPRRRELPGLEPPVETPTQPPQIAVRMPSTEPQPPRKPPVSPDQASNTAITRCNNPCACPGCGVTARSRTCTAMTVVAAAGKNFPTPDPKNATPGRTPAGSLYHRRSGHWPRPTTTDRPTRPRPRRPAAHRTPTDRAAARAAAAGATTAPHEAPTPVPGRRRARPPHLAWRPRARRRTPSAAEGPGPGQRPSAGGDRAGRAPSPPGPRTTGPPP